jgi:glyoxylase-like metal-dependent hydrolase (beta-lactamase superfamily II)
MPTEVARGVYSIGRDRIEIYAIEEAGKLTLIDSGLKSDWKQIVTQVGALGMTLDDIEAVVVTHAHLDHYGCAERLRQEAGASVHVHAADEAVATGKSQIKRDPDSRNPLSYGLPALITLFQFLFKGALSQPPPVLEVSAFDDGRTLDVPGRPRVIHVPGHTDGSACFLIEDRDAILTGDALITFNFSTRKPGPQISPAVFNADNRLAMESLKNLDGVRAATVLPGHGGPWNDGLDTALAEARRLGPT